MQYKVVNMSGLPLNTGYKIIYDEDNNKTTEAIKTVMPAITGSETEEVEFSVEGILNYLGTQGWELVSFDEDVYVLKK